MIRIGAMRRAHSALALLLLAGACASSGGVPPASTSSFATTTATSTAAESTVYGGEVVIGIGTVAAPRTLNPLLEGPDTAVLDLIAPAVGARAFTVDPETLEVSPEVVEALPELENGLITDNGDGTVAVEMRVTPGAVWSDGVPVTAADLEFTYDLATDPFIPIRRDARVRFQSVVPGSMRAEGAVLRFDMSAPPVDLVRMFDVIVPRHHVEGTNFVEDWSDTMWASAGPFSFADRVPGRFVSLARNPAYWKVTGVGGDPLPFLDRVVLRFYEVGDGPDPRVVDEFASMDTDLALLGPVQATAAPDGAQVAFLAPDGWHMLGFQFGPDNSNPGTLNRHLEFRRAVAHSVDRTALAAVSGGDPLLSALAPYLPDRTSEPWSAFPRDPQQAGAALDELGERLSRDLGRGDGPAVLLTVPETGDAIVALAGELAAALRSSGLDAGLQVEDAALFLGGSLADGAWDLSILEIPSQRDPAAAVALVRLFDPDAAPPEGGNVWRWGSDGPAPRSGRYRRVLQDLAGAIDLDTIRAMLAEAEAILAEQLVMVPLATVSADSVASWPGTLAGLDPTGGDVFTWNVAVWRRVGG